MAYCFVRRAIVGALWIALGAVGCGSSPRNLDGGVGDSTARDGIRPPDLRNATDSGSGSGNIGAPCELPSGKGCTGQAQCLQVGREVGVCAIFGCTMEDLSTTKREDSCPADAACNQLPVEAAPGQIELRTFCLPRCVPAVDHNGCATINPKLTCDPGSILANGHAEVCVRAACTKDADCGNMNPLAPDSTCDTKTGSCLVLGKPGGAIGTPCKLDTDCGKNQVCLPERKDKNGVKIAGGYCSLIGCKLGGPWQCPASSKCFILGSTKAVSLCLAVGCDPKKPASNDGCRDEAAADQYKCVAVDSEAVCWLNLPTN